MKTCYHYLIILIRLPLPLFNYFASIDRFLSIKNDGAYCQSNENQIVPDHALSYSAISFKEQSNESTTNGSISMIDRKESYKSQACENTITPIGALIDTCRKDSVICDQVISYSKVNVREESSQSQEKEQISVHDYSVNITDDGNILIPKSILNVKKRIKTNPNIEVDLLNIINKNSSPTLSYRDFSTTNISQVSIIIGYKFQYRYRTLAITFPSKLHEILERSDIDGYSSIISWAKHGRSFKIHNQPLFVKRVLSFYFYTSNFKSFSHNLSSYGFHKITASDNQDRYSYYNELFLRGRPELCLFIV